MEFLDKNANAGNYTSCSISAAEARKRPRVARKSRGPPRKNIVALSRKFMLETAVGLFRVPWSRAAPSFLTTANDREKTQRFAIVDLSSRTDNVNK